MISYKMFKEKILHIVSLILARSLNKLCFLSLLLSYVIYDQVFFDEEIFFHFFFKELSVPFFVIDSSVGISRYIEITSFFVFCIYAPFLYIYRVFFRLPLCTSKGYSIRLRGVFMRIYVHRVSMLLNHFDFSDIVTNTMNTFFSFCVQNTDFAAYIHQYLGMF